MVACGVCGKEIRRGGGANGIHERDQVYHIECAPEDLLDDAASEWSAIFRKGVKYFIKKYSVHMKSGGRLAYVDRFADMGRGITAELKRREKLVRLRPDSQS